MSQSDTLKTNDSVTSSRRSSVVPVRPHLFVVTECDRLLSGGARYELTNLDELVIGRGTERSLTRDIDATCHRARLTLPGRALSNVHARVVRRGVEWLFEDAGSTNGSRINGFTVAQRVLEDADCIEVGHTLLELRLAVPTPAGTPRDFDSLAAPPDESLVTLVPSLADQYSDLAKVAHTNVAIVLEGKTGTGKEVVANAIHRLSERKGPFVAVNCGALVPSLLESQLFGHVQGAFSGALRDELGLIRSADRGTLLLDEIGDLPLPAQAALLRTIQESEVLPVGHTRAVRVDVRIVTATQEPLRDLVASGRFREDLRSRLEGHVVDLPTLAERREDLGILIGRLLRKLSPNQPTLRPSVARSLLSYHWPLNIRELELVLRRAVALSAGEAITWRHLPKHIAGTTAPISDAPIPIEPGRVQNTVRPALSQTDQELRAQVIASLREHSGNISEVARTTGKARSQIQRWLRRLAIDPSEYRSRK